MIKDFNINYGLSTELFIDGQVNPDLIIEAGCWYLCTDTAELFLGVQSEDGLALKRINERSEIDPEVLEALHSEINAVKESLADYATKSELFSGSYNDLSDKPEIPSLEGYATEQYVIDAIETHEGIAKKEEVLEVKTQLETEVLPKVETVDELRTWVENKEYIQDIDLEGYATKEFVSEAIKDVTIPESEIYKVDFNAPDFTAAIDAYKNGKFLVLTNAAPDANGYAVMNYVRADLITFTKFLTSRSETYGAFNTYYLHSDNTWEVSKEVKLNKVEITTDGNLQVGKQLFEVPSIDGLATEEFVNRKIAEAELADKEADLENYHTKSEVSELLATKADKILFVKDKFVSKAFGGFTVGENIKDLTIAELFAKLLELADEPIEAPDEPSDTPIKDAITEENLTIYQADTEGNIVEVPYTRIQFTDETAKVAPIESGFYEINNTSGDITEYGYQHVTEPQDTMFYVVALPSDVILGVNASLKTWDTMSEQWIDVDETVLTSDFDEITSVFVDEEIEIPTIPDGYTLWADLSDINAGSIYRIVINEGV